MTNQEHIRMMMEHIDDLQAGKWPRNLKCHACAGSLVYTGFRDKWECTECHLRLWSTVPGFGLFQAEQRSKELRLHNILLFARGVQAGLILFLAALVSAK